MIVADLKKHLLALVYMARDWVNWASSPMAKTVL